MPRSGTSPNKERARHAQPERRGTRTSRASSSVDVLVCAPATEDLCVAELARASVRARVEVPGVLSVPEGAKTRGLAFVRQVLPSARLLVGENASDLADLAARALLAHAPDAWLSGALVVDVSHPDVEKKGSRPVDAHPLAEGVIHVADVLAKKRVGRAEKVGVAPAVAGAAMSRVEVLVTGAWRAWISAPHPLDEDALTAWPVAFPAGRAPVAIDKKAPSSAHRKLDEALAWIGRVPEKGDVVLDLGAAPGGFTHVALRHGAHVVAVDRGDMDPRLLANDRVTHVRRDAFQVAIGEDGARGLVDDADWLVCDIIVEPERTLALLERALSSARLRACVVTLKLRRPVDFAVLARARALFAQGRFVGRVVCLASNKVEVTVLGRAR